MASKPTPEKSPSAALAKHVRRFSRDLAYLIKRMDDVEEHLNAQTGSVRRIIHLVSTFISLIDEPRPRQHLQKPLHTPSKCRVLQFSHNQKGE